MNKLFYKLFGKKEKSQKFNWILRTGIIIFSLAVFLTIFAIVVTMLANIDKLTWFGMDLNDISSYCGIAACTCAIVAMFFIFCGKVKE
jgi:uncharacterized membrane protein